MADIFLKSDVRSVFRDRKVLFMGDSVLRNLYQDFVYLIEKGTLTPNSLLKKKGKQIEDGEFPGDSLVEGGDLIPGREYQEVLINDYVLSSRSVHFKLSPYFISRCASLKVQGGKTFRQLSTSSAVAMIWAGW